MFAKHSNPAVDRPIMRKKLAYLEVQVREFLADWVDSGEKSRGVVCRDLLNFGPRQEPEASVIPDRDRMPSGEIPGCRFELRRRAVPVGAPPVYIRIPWTERESLVSA